MIEYIGETDSVIGRYYSARITAVHLSDHHPEKNDHDDSGYRPEPRESFLDPWTKRRKSDNEKDQAWEEPSSPERDGSPPVPLGRIHIDRDKENGKEGPCPDRLFFAEEKKPGKRR